MALSISSRGCSRKCQQRIWRANLGTDPATGRQLSVRLGKFGPMAQIGTADEEEKQVFASVPPHCN